MRFAVLTIFFLFFAFYILHSTFYISPALALCLTQPTNPRVQNGLISTPSFSGTNKFGNLTGECVDSNLATFVPYKIPGYNDLKSLYFTQSKVLNKPVNTGSTLATATDGYIYNYTNAAGVSTGAIGTPYSYTGTAVVFIEGSLTINGNITGTSDKGLVLVVGGNVIIDTSVTRIDAVIISQGIIYTAGAGCTKNNVPVANANALIVNGSLVSLDPGSIIFCRKLTDNRNPAEVINNQPKYLVILRDLMSDTLQKWSEIQ